MKAQLPDPSTWGTRLTLGYHQWAGPLQSRLWSRVQAATTPKPKPKLLVAAQQHHDELAAKQRGAPHGTHVRPMVQQSAQTRPPGSGLHSWKQNANPSHTGNSNLVSIEEHSEFTMATLMRRDALHRIDLDEDIVSICDSSDIEMVSTHEYDQETEDSSPDSDAEDSHHPSDGSDMESDQDWCSGWHSDLDSKQGSDPSSAPYPTPIWAATMVVTPSPVMMTGVISRTCSWQKKSVLVPPRDPNHSRLLTATADPGKPRTKNDGMFLPQKMIQIWTSRIGRKLLPKPLPRRSLLRAK